MSIAQLSKIGHALAAKSYSKRKTSKPNNNKITITKRWEEGVNTY